MWFWLAFASAFFGALEIILSKQSLKKVSAAVLTWALLALTIPILFIISLYEGFPTFNITFLIAAIGSTLTYVFGRTIVNETLKHNLISKIFPLTAFSGVFTYLFGLVILSETLRLIPVLGLLLVIFGSYILNVDQMKEDILRPFKLLFTTKVSLLFLFAVMITSLTAIFDKMGILNTNPSSPVFVMLTQNVMMSTLLTIYLITRQSKTWVLELKQNFGILFLVSIIFLVASYFAFTAYIDGPAALVLGIKRLQIFFILLMGYLFFKDKPTKHVWVATAIMIFGALLIKIG